MEPVQPARKKPAWKLLFLLLLFLALGVLTGITAFNLGSDSALALENARLDGPALQPTGERGSTAPRPGLPASTERPPIPMPTPDPWDGTARVTVLLMGLDYRDWEQGEGPPRTDTMILLTVDPLSKTAGMLSIPRDLWVSIPGMGEYKINSAHRFGELYRLPGGGPGLAMKTVENTLGVPVDFYAVIDFYAFERFIDELGGIEVEVSEEIKVDPIGKGNTVVLEPGKHTLDGPTALGYARNRSTRLDDFDRSTRQHQVIYAIRDRILRLDMLPQLVYKAPQLYEELKAGVRTNLSLKQAIQLAWLAQQIPEESITSRVIGPNEVRVGKSPDGLDIYTPVEGHLRLLRDEVFGTSGERQAARLSLKEQAGEEQARLELVNGTQQGDAAKRAALLLENQGLVVQQVTPASEAEAETRLVDFTGNPYTLKYLVQLLKVKPEHITSAYDPSSPVDVQVILGRDWLKANP